MAKQSGIGDRLFSHGNDLSGDVGAVNNITATVALLETTAIEDASHTRTQGLGDGAMSYNAYFNDDDAANRAGAAGSTHVILSTLPTTDVVLLYARGTTLGNPCAGLVAKQVDYPGNRGNDGALMFSVNAQSSGGAPAEWGNLLTAGLITHASATSATGIVDAAQTTAGGVGYLQGVAAASGTATVLIEDSSDTTNGTDGIWGTLLTFATTSGSWPAGERLTVTGTVEKGLRATTTGTFTNADFVVGFRRGESGDREDLS